MLIELLGKKPLLGISEAKFKSFLGGWITTARTKYLRKTLVFM